jgi:DNA-binding HxlR family transcriptional regulator
MADKQVSCLVETTLDVIGGRWKVLILQQLFGGVKRFNELRRALAGITHKTLTQQLREMESDGIINRKLYPQVPPKVEYSLTPLGKTLKSVLTAMHNWAERHGAALQGRKRGHISHAVNPSSMVSLAPVTKRASGPTR